MPRYCSVCGAPWTSVSGIERTRTAKALVECECAEGHLHVLTAAVAPDIYDWAVSGD